MGWITAFLVAISLLVPVKFVTEEPGPALNTLGEYDGKQLISIEGRKTYPTSGELAMTTVSVAGGPNTNIRALQTLATWLMPDTVVVPSDLMYSPTTTNEQVNTQNEADMTDSQEVAQAAALEYLKIDYDLKLTISGFIEQDGQEAAQQLQEGDQLLALGGNRLKTYDQISDILDNNGEKGQAKAQAQEAQRRSKAQERERQKRNDALMRVGTNVASQIGRQLVRSLFGTKRR